MTLYLQTPRRRGEKLLNKIPSIPEREQARRRSRPADEREPGRVPSHSLAIQALAALDAEAVPAQVVMPARGTHEAARWIGLQPALTFAAVPDAVLGTEHPSSAFAVEDGQVSNRDPESPCLQASNPALFHQAPVTRLGVGERVDSHAESIAPEAGSSEGRV